MSHAVMCGNTREEERGGCFVPWCTCWCHRTPGPTVSYEDETHSLTRAEVDEIMAIARRTGLITDPVDRGALVVVSEYRVVHECGLDLATGDPVEAEELKRNHRCPPQAPTPASATDTSE